MTATATNWRGVIFGLGLSSFAAYQLFKLPPALPLLLETYGYDRTLAGGFMSIYALIGLALSLPLGRAIERRGLVAPILAALGLLVLGNLTALVAPQLGLVMLAARGIEGLGFAVLAIIGPVLANTQASLRHLPLVFGMTATWIPIGQLAATLIAPFAFALHGWQMLWWAAIAASAALALWTLGLARSGRVALTARARAAAPRPAGAAISSWERLSLILAGSIFLLWSGQYFAYMTWLPQYLVEVHGLTASSALVGYALPVTMLIVFSLLTGWLLRGGVPLGVLFVGALASQAAVWWLLPATAGGGWIGLLSLVTYGAGAGIVPACLFAMPSTLLGQGRAPSTAFGLLMTGRNVGVFLGPIALAEAFKQAASWEVAGPIFGTVTTAALALGGLLALRLGRRRR